MDMTFVDRVIDTLEVEHYQGEVFGSFAYPYKEVERGVKMAYLEGLMASIKMTEEERLMRIQQLLEHIKNL